MTSDGKTNLSEILAGDEVAYKPHSNRHDFPMERRKVERVTPTQIVLDEYRKFYKKNGREVGANVWRAEEIFPLGAEVWDRYDGKGLGITYAQLVEREQTEEKNRQRRQDLADWIRNRLARGPLEIITTEQLEQAAKLLGYEAKST